MSCIELAPLDEDALTRLGELAAAVIVRAVTDAPHSAAVGNDPRFAAPGASFVTLKQREDLRGCIGTLLASRALHADVAANARAAALRDPRFAPLMREELSITTVEVSVLSPPQDLSFTDEQDFYRQLRPGSDGLIIEHQGRRATYLPSVWQQLGEPWRFVEELRRKAGIAPQVPLTALSVQRYTSQHSLPRPLLCAL